MKIKFLESLLIILLLVAVGVNCNKTDNTTKEVSDKKVQQNENKDEPPKNLVEKEVMNIVNRIPAEDYKYNASIFLDQDGVFKNLVVTNTEILIRSPIQNVEGMEQQTIQVSITGIMDKYAVGGGLPPSLISKGRGNYVVEKEFVFKKKNDTWLGYINDNARSSGSLKFKKKLMR